MTQAYSMTITEERLVDLVNPHKNSAWQFVVCKNCKYEETGTRLSKIVVATSLVDRRDHANQRFSVKVSKDGSVIYARSPYHPQFLMEDFEKNFHNACPETKLAHQAYAYTRRRKQQSPIVHSGLHIVYLKGAPWLPITSTTLAVQSAVFLQRELMDYFKLLWRWEWTLIGWFLQFLGLPMAIKLCTLLFTPS